MADQTITPQARTAPASRMHSVTVQRPRGLKSLVIVTTAIALLCSAVPALAGTVYAGRTSPYAGHATYSASDGHVSGFVYDTLPEGECVRVYDRGWNAVFKWGNWKYLGQACGSGKSTWFSDSLYLYSDKVDLRVCIGFYDCYPVRAWG